jgi:hypothetical protein
LPRFHGRRILFDLLTQWASDEAVRNRILVIRSTSSSGDLVVGAS